MIYQSEWEGMVHTFADFETKERLKSELGFSQVPFVVIGLPVLTFFFFSLCCNYMSVCPSSSSYKLL